MARLKPARPPARGVGAAALGALRSRLIGLLKPAPGIVLPASGPPGFRRASAGPGWSGPVSSGRPGSRWAWRRPPAGSRRARPAARSTCPRSRSQETPRRGRTARSRGGHAAVGDRRKRGCQLRKKGSDDRQQLGQRGSDGNDRRGRLCHGARRRRDRRGTTRGRWRGCGGGGRSGCRGGAGVRRGGDGRRGGLGGRGGSQHGGGLEAEAGGVTGGGGSVAVGGGSARLRPEPGRSRPEPGRSRPEPGRLPPAARSRREPGWWPAAGAGCWAGGSATAVEPSGAPRRRPAPGPRGPAGSRREAHRTRRQGRG